MNAQWKYFVVSFLMHISHKIIGSSAIQLNYDCFHTNIICLSFPFISLHFTSLLRAFFQSSQVLDVIQCDTLRFWVCWSSFCHNRNLTLSATSNTQFFTVYCNWTISFSRAIVEWNGFNSWQRVSNTLAQVLVRYKCRHDIKLYLTRNLSFFLIVQCKLLKWKITKNYAQSIRFMLVIWAAINSYA